MIKEGFIKEVTKNLMFNLDKNNSTSTFEIDAEYMGMILKELFDHSPFNVSHINFPEIEILLDISSKNGERVETEVWIDESKLRIKLQSEVGKLVY